MAIIYIFLYLNKLYRSKFDIENTYRGRIHHTFINYKNYGVIYGGIESKNILKDLLMFDFLTNTWTCLKEQNEEDNHKGVFGHSANIYDNQMICFGGCDGKVLLKELKTYSFQDKK